MTLALEGSVESTYVQNVRAVYRYCLWRVNSASDAEDITTEVFIKLLAGKAEAIGSERLPAWLIKVADNECKMFFRRRGRRSEVAWENSAEIAATDARPWISPEICAAVKGLKQKQKIVLFLKAVEGLTFKEIAEALGAAEGSVKMTFYRATKRLSGLLEEVARDA